MANELDLQKHLEILSSSPRLIGSEHNINMSKYIQQVFSEAGLNVVLQRFECPNWEHVKTELIFNDIVLPAIPNTFTSSCDIIAEFICASNINELEDSECRDRILVLYGDLTAQPLIAKGNKIYNPERDKKINLIIEKKQPIAVITVSHKNDDVLPIIEDWDFKIPSLTVPYNIGLLLKESANGQVTIRINALSTPSYSNNVIGKTLGDNKRRIVICSHYDTKANTPGAFDNASGVSVLLELARMTSNKNYNYCIEFIAFSAEEYYGLGDLEYVRQFGNDFDDILLAINIDGVGPKSGSNNIAMLESSDELIKLVKASMEYKHEIVWTEPWYASNHFTFFTRNVPSIAISSVGLSEICHLESDTLDNISLNRLVEVLNLIMKILEEVNNKEEQNFRKEHSMKD